MPNTITSHQTYPGTQAWPGPARPGLPFPAAFCRAYDDAPAHSTIAVPVAFFAQRLAKSSLRSPDHRGRAAVVILKI